ncbi:MAG: hypothetical protein R2912_05370 [Eubacteriales bacterium]
MQRVGRIPAHPSASRSTREAAWTKAPDRRKWIASRRGSARDAVILGHKARHLLIHPDVRAYVRIVADGFLKAALTNR